MIDRYRGLIKFTVGVVLAIKLFGWIVDYSAEKAAGVINDES